MMKYKVLWFDDEYQTLETISDDALRSNIELIGYTNADDGLEELQRNSVLYDAIIVDGLFFEKRSHSGDAKNETAFGKVALAITKLKEKDIVIPWFILSGQKSFVQERNRLVDVLADKDFGHGRVYDKNNDDDIDQLFNEIIKACNEIDNTRVRKKYYRVFEACTNEYLGEQAACDLLKILINMDNIEVSEYFNDIRKIIEDILLTLNKFRLLPDSFVKPSVAFNEASRFLAGKDFRGEYFIEKGYKHLDETHIPISISNNIRFILSVVQPASHRSFVDDHIKQVRTPYLFYSVLYQLFDVIIWLKLFIDSKPKAHNWEIDRPLSDERIAGIIEQDEEGNYFCMEHLLNETYTGRNYSVGDNILILKSEPNTNIRTNQKYPKYASQFERNQD